MKDIIIAVLLVAVVFTFLLAWGYVKQQRRNQELLAELMKKSQEKVMKEIREKGPQSKKDIEGIIAGTKASVFWSRKKLQITDPKILSVNLITDMVYNNVIREVNIKGIKKYEIY